MKPDPDSDARQKTPDPDPEQFAAPLIAVLSY